MLLDDGPHNLLGGQYVPVLYTRPHNRSYDANADGVYRVDSWCQFYNLVNNHLAV